MIDPGRPIDPARLTALRREATDRLGVFFDPKVVERVSECIVERVRDGAVGDGILYRELVSGSGAPSWVAHPGLFGSVLALVSVQSYETQQVLLSALARASRDQPLPTAGFCEFLEQLGQVSSQRNREECLEIWDHHWKMAISSLDVRWRAGGRHQGDV